VGAGLLVQVRGLRGQGEGLTVRDGSIAGAARRAQRLAVGVECARLAGPVAGLPVQDGGLVVEPRGLLKAPLPPVDDAEVA
jgi:hypothetical protein